MGKTEQAKEGKRQKCGGEGREMREKEKGSKFGVRK